MNEKRNKLSNIIIVVKNLKIKNHS